MPIEKSAGAIIFRRENDKIYYLSLHYPPSATRAAAKGQEEGLSSLPTRAAAKGQEEGLPSSPKTPKEYWDLPKGHIEKGEKQIETVRREVEEETGLKDIEFLEGFKKWIKYFFKFKGVNILKFVTFYLVKTKTKDIKISREHLDYKWLLYEEAIEKLTFKNAKEILKKANDFIIEYGI